MANLPDEKIEAQLTKYFHKVICNAASNYYKKKFYQTEKEFTTEKIFDQLIDEIDFENNILTQIMITESPLAIFDETVREYLPKLTIKEQRILIEKFVFNKTDKEIGLLFGVSRQAVTNMKHRLYKKINSNMYLDYKE
ncbi:sigma-70 family RNA polymerase sigma factor [Enterococcus faecalis]